jgi:hypothetical protein
MEMIGDFEDLKKQPVEASDRPPSRLPSGRSSLASQLNQKGAKQLSSALFWDE